MLVSGMTHKGHIGSPKGHSGLWKRPTDKPVLPAYKYLDFLCRGVLTKCKNSIPPLDLLPLCLSSTKSHSPPHSLPQPHRTDPPTNKPPFEPEQAAVLCAHSELRIPSIFFWKGRRRSFVSTNIPATNSISVSINSTSYINQQPSLYLSSEGLQWTPLFQSTLVCYTVILLSSSTVSLILQIQSDILE